MIMYLIPDTWIDTLHSLAHFISPKVPFPLHSFSNKTGLNIQPTQVYAVISTLQMRKLRLREIQRIVQGHTINNVLFCFFSV